MATETADDAGKYGDTKLERPFIEICASSFYKLKSIENRGFVSHYGILTVMI